VEEVLVIDARDNRLLRVNNQKMKRIKEIGLGLGIFCLVFVGIVLANFSIEKISASLLGGLNLVFVLSALICSFYFLRKRIYVLVSFIIPFVSFFIIPQIFFFITSF